MLERVLKHAGVVVKVVGVDKVVVCCCKNVASTHARLREVYLGRIDACEDFAVVVGKAFPQFVAHVRRSLAVAYNFNGFFDLYRAMIGSNKQADWIVAQFLEEYKEVGMFKPTLCER